MPRFYSISALLLFAAFSIATSLYCILTFIPFTFHHVVESKLFPELFRLAEAHHWLNLAVFLVVSPAVLPALMRRRGPAARFWAAFAWLAAFSGWTLYLLWRPVLPALGNDVHSFTISLIPAVLALWFSALGVSSEAEGFDWPEEPSNSGGMFSAAILAALWAPLVTGIVASWRQGGATPGDWARGYLWSGSAQAVVLLGGFVALHWAASLARFAKSVARAEFVLAHAAAAALGTAAIARISLHPVGFEGWRCWLYAFGLSSLLTVSYAAVALALSRGRAASGFEMAFAPWSAGRAGSWKAALAGGVVIAAACGSGLIRFSAMDWNSLVQRLITVMLWMASFGVAFGFAHRRVPGAARWAPFLLSALALLGGYRKLQARLTPAAAEIDAYAGYDAAFSYARELLAPPRAAGAVFDLMAHSTNLPQSARVAPVEVNAVRRIEPHPKRPHIFIITVDSLRQDYLSPYNPAVKFTPSIGSFARESTVFAPAFTHYGGTGLSEPSIWAGAMMIHKQYVTPFAPMNLLEKLLRGEGYRFHVSRDEILRTILGPSRPGDRDLDAGRPTMKFDLCTSLDELSSVVSAAPAGQPLFAFTQPQNIHISVIQREGAKPVDGEDYSGFYSPYASRLRRMDGCFGNFIASLKRQGVYDSSIIILTADHGDSLGEEGRWGHAYTIFPEIVRIPLIIHIPSGAGGVRPIQGRPAFSTDITPTLYHLLGYREIAEIPLGGSPLFTDAADGRVPAGRDWYLLASSYASVYGVLSENGRRMYVADGVSFRDYWFDLSGPRAAALTLPDDVRVRQQARIREGIEEINALYGFSASARKGDTR